MQRAWTPALTGGTTNMRIDSVVFGFGHRMRHGKDTVANEIIKQRSGQYDIRSYSFARELKEEVNKNAMGSGGMIKLFDDGLRGEGCGYMQTNDNIIALPDWVQYDPNPDMTDPLCPYGKQRSLLQWWGTEYRRNVEPDYWVKKIAERIEKEKPEISLISDMRFPNEFSFCMEYGEAIKVERQNPDGTLYVVPGVTPHISETALANIPDDEWSAVIYNDRGLDELKQLAVYTFDELMEKTQ